MRCVYVCDRWHHISIHTCAHIYTHSLCVCVYVCMYVCMHVVDSDHWSWQVTMQQMHTYVLVALIYIYAHIHTCLCACNKYIRMIMWIRPHNLTKARTRCVCVCANVRCVYVCDRWHHISIHTCAHIYTHIHTYIHTYTLTHAYTCIPVIIWIRPRNLTKARTHMYNVFACTHIHACTCRIYSTHTQKQKHIYTFM